MKVSSSDFRSEHSSVSNFPIATRTPREKERTPSTKPTSAITTEAVVRITGSIDRRPAARSRDELSLLHHGGEVAPHRPLADARDPLADGRCGEGAVAGDEIIDDPFHLRARTAAPGPADCPASLRARCGVMAALALRHSGHDRRAGGERAARVARADALPIDGDAGDVRADELPVDEAVAQELADDDVARALALPTVEHEGVR